MSRIMTKKELYTLVTQKIIESGYDVHAKRYRVDSRELAHRACVNLLIEEIPFLETKICGILHKAAGATTIALNARRSDKGKNFDCMHELIHYWFHEDSYFYCHEDVSNHLEWQANEGAAQFLMPYQHFVPFYHRLFDRFYARFSPNMAYAAVVSYMSHHYNVGEMSIKIRFNSLKNEIADFADNTFK